MGSFDLELSATARRNLYRKRNCAKKWRALRRAIAAFYRF